jgi:hypothetical protein
LIYDARCRSGGGRFVLPSDHYSAKIRDISSSHSPEKGFMPISRRTGWNAGKC